MTGFKLNPIENKRKRVLTTAQLAEAYGTNSKVISKNFNRNIDRYIEGKHFYRLTGAEKREFCNRHQIDDGSKATDFYLWTERGSLLHAKSINTDRAWKVHEFLVDNYFRAQEITSSYNDMFLQMFERMDRLEQRMGALEKQSPGLVKDIVDAVIEPCFKRLDEEIKKIDNTVTKSDRNIIRSVSENIKLLGTYIDTLIKKIK